MISMINTKKYFFALALAFAAIAQANAQSTTNSPYSRFGVGNLKGAYLPQNKAMGNLGYGISSVGAYNNINMANPASYSQIRLTAFDIGVGADLQKLDNGIISENTFNATLDYLAFAVPVTKKSALSFGLMPYSNLGFNYRQTVSVDTFLVDQVYQGEGGLSRAYLGYGIGIGKNINLGFNMSYLFGNLKQSSASVYSTRYIGFLDAKKEVNNSIGGLTFDLGVQYVAALSDKVRLTLGYTGGLKSTLNNQSNTLSTRYMTSSGSEFRADTVSYLPDNEQDVILPANHNFGFSIAKTNRWLVGADFRMADWSTFRINNASQDLGKTWGFSLGGQIVPDANAVTSYFKLVDYRLGISYDKTYLNIQNTDIDVRSLNFGFGFPLVSNRSAFYKINFTTEIGKRGTLENNLIKENFYRFSLGFTINDRWFQKYKYD